MLGNFLSKDYKRILYNFLSLVVLQGANYLLPLITIPYLLRVIGPEKFGLIAFAQAFIQYFVIFVDYGFNFSATREVSLYRENKKKLSEILTSVLLIKISLLLISFIILTIVVFSFEKFKKDWIIYFLTFGIVLGQTLFPVWFFQGIEKMKYITALNVLSKIIFTSLIFLIVKDINSYVYVPLLNSLGLIIASLLGIFLILKKFNVHFTKVEMNKLLLYLKEGWHIFISSVGINLYKTTSIFLLGLFTNNKIVGYFYTAKKIVDLANNINAVLSQSIYPYTVKNINKKNLKKFFYFIIAFILFYTSIIGIVFFFYADLIIYIISGEKYLESIISLKLMAFVPLIIGLNIPGVHILLGKKLDHVFSKIVITGGILLIILDLILIPKFSYIGSCTSVIITEIFVTVAIYIFIKKYTNLRGKDRNEM